MSSAMAPGLLAAVLVTQLGAPHYHRRARASRALYRLTPLVIPYLEGTRKHPDMEISQRSTQLLASYYESMAEELTAKMLPTGWPRLPWLDMLPKDYPNRKAVVDFYLAKAQKKIGRKGPPFWDDYRLATRMYIHELFLNQHSPKEVRRLLDGMVEGERQWIIKNGKKYSPPLELPK